MKTSFSMRVDKNRELNLQLDEDYFNTYTRQTKIDALGVEVKNLEDDFKQLREKHFGANSEVKLSELIKVREVKEVLEKLRYAKSKLQKLEIAMREAIESKNKDL